MNIQQLEYVLAVDKHRHFLKASESCFITQATLSAMIKKLEEELNVILFDRNKHPVEPTAIGKKIIEQAKKSLREIYRIQDIINEEKDEVKGELRIGIIPSLAPYLLPLFIKQFLDTYQDVALTINEYTTSEIQEKLLEGSLDVGILAIPLLNNDLKESTLFYEEFFYYSNTDVLSKSKQHILPKDVNPNNLLLLEEGHCFRNQVFNLCELRKKDFTSLKLNYQSGSIETIRKMVDLNMGCTILPELTLSMLTTEQKQKLSRFEKPSPVREIGLVTHRHFIKEKLIKVLNNCILDAIPQSMLDKSCKTIIPLQ
ncbi:LysR substrate-binding domain-containing protein [Flavobacterium sp. TR2]|uniref:hydrogen peroxide-inducible genes activator n=1 Tax=Flavobacterium sp. TR2 TaxID=2977321 RepID=UPI0021B101B4|nr:hydrogen peroxide-inducible genes activator [Flavobacterium sp. TR2]UWY28028.1 LysR substrate-binding domain-containing protein [Flavobacterium sp. TR2]